jgi:hypothetical protein
MLIGYPRLLQGLAQEETATSVVVGRDGGAAKIARTPFYTRLSALLDAAFRTLEKQTATSYFPRCRHQELVAGMGKLDGIDLVEAIQQAGNDADGIACLIASLVSDRVKGKRQILLKSYVRTRGMFPRSDQDCPQYWIWVAMVGIFGRP